MTVDNKNYKLPELPEPEDKWKPIPRHSRQVPFGYKVADYDEDILEPIPDELHLLEMARGHLKNYSYRVVAAWLSEASGRYISHMGLRNRIRSENQNKFSANGYYINAKKLQKTLQKLREIEEDRVGSLKGGSRAREFEEFVDPSDTETKPD